VVCGAFVGLALLTLQLPRAIRTQAQPGGLDWPKYLYDNSGSGFTPETLITPANAAAVAARSGWPVHAANPRVISTQPLVVNGLVYWGSWDGFEHATPASGGGDTWSVNIGTSSTPACGSIGVASTADIASVGATPYLFVGGGGTSSAGGGQAQLYALNPATGAVYWHTPLGAAPDNQVWDSPAVYTANGRTSVYIGLASFCDEPLVQGKLFELDAATGVIQHVFSTVPDGCLGAGIWGSPTIDTSDGSIYVVTGNPGSCSTGEIYAVDLLKLRASDLTLLDFWQVPAAEQVGGTVQGDSDFGNTPTLFTGTVKPGLSQRNLVGVGNKNGIYYVFDRASLTRGPMARLKIARGCGDPFCGGTISPSAWDGSQLYVAGGATSVQGVNFKGSLRAFSPNNLVQPLWTLPFTDGPVLGAVTASPGLAVVGEGPYTVVVHSTTGAILVKRPVSSILSSQPATFFAAPSIAQGVLYEGDIYGNLYAYSVGGQ
jgi:polyvinyl alcohol dehydrogenase (cytochrome)